MCTPLTWAAPVIAGPHYYAILKNNATWMT